VPISPQDEQTIRQWAETLPSPPVVRLARAEEEGDEALSAFCAELKRLVPGTTIKPGPDEAFRAPALIIGRHQNIAYQAVPQGRELPPFLELLRKAAENTEDDTPAKIQAARIALPAQMTLFITAQCPHCPQAAQSLFDLAHYASQLRLAVVDGTLFTSQAVDENIRSVPTLILDGQLRWTGPIDLLEVVDQCVHRDPAQLSAASLRQSIESGEAGRIAAMMREHDQIFPALIDLLVHPRWSVRLGAMVTVEYLADESPKLAERLVAPLWERFSAIDISAQGDVIQVFGQIQSVATRHLLESIVSGNYDASVKEAAQEELDGWTAA